MTKQEIIKGLIEENNRFTCDNSGGKLGDSLRRQALINGQSPHTIVLSCADSRVVPELIFDAGLGELFVLRIAGNIATKEIVASIEYAVAHLGSIIIVVLGHENCGAVNSAISGGDHGENLNQLLKQIQPAIDACDSSSTTSDVIKKNIELTANDLIERSKIIDNAVEKEAVQIIQAFYHLDSGVVDFL